MTINRSTVASLAIIALFFTFAMCVKTDDPTTEDAALLKSFFDKNAPKTETFTFNANQSFTITTSKGSTIGFPANSLLDGTGKVATGTVEVSVKEVRTAADMLLSDKPTVVKDGGAMLISFGEIKVDAMQNGKALRIRDTVGLNVNMAFVPNAAQIREMPLWNGDTTVSVTTSGLNSEGVKTTVTNSLPAMKGITWSQLSTWALANPTTNKVNFLLDKLGQWRNCDALYNDTRPKTTILGYFSTHFNNATMSTYQGLAPSSLFFKPKGQNTLVKLYNLIVTPTAGKEGFYSYENSIPIGMEGTFLAISTIGGKFYADMKDVTITAPASGKTFMGISFNPIEISETDLLAKINLLNGK